MLKEIVKNKELKKHYEYIKHLKSLDKKTILKYKIELKSLLTNNEIRFIEFLSFNAILNDILKDI